MTFHAYTLVFGIISIGFGLLGFLRAKSKASLIAGSISGLLLILGWYLAEHGGAAKAGFWLSLVVTFLLLGKFLPTALKRKQLYPAGIMAVLALVGLVLGLKTLL